MPTQRQGLAFIVCAPSGAGKTTLCKRLLSEVSSLAYSVSCTTRPPRPGEVDGKDYFFLSQEEFLKLCQENKFIEWAKVHGNYYGTLRSVVQEKLCAGQDLLFDIDVQGAAQIKLNITAPAFFAFILPPSMAELEQRLRLRGTEEEATARKRLANACQEIESAHWFDFLIMNGDVEQAYFEFKSAYLAAGLAPRCQSAQLNALLQEIKAL